MPPPPTTTKTPASNRETPTVAAELVGARFSGKRRTSGHAGSARALKGVAALVDVEGAGATTTTTATTPGVAAELVASRFSGKKRESSGATATATTTTTAAEGGEGGVPATGGTPARDGTPTLAAELVGSRFSGRRRKSSHPERRVVAADAAAGSPGAAARASGGLAAPLRLEDDPAEPSAPAKKTISDDPAPRLPARKSRRKPEAPASIFGIGAKSDDREKSAAETETGTAAANAAAAEEARVVAEAAAARTSTPATAPPDPRGIRFDDAAEDAPDAALRPATIFAKLGVSVFGSGRKSNNASGSTPRARTPRTAAEKKKPSGRTAMSLLGL